MKTEFKNYKLHKEKSSVIVSKPKMDMSTEKGGNILKIED